MRKVSGGVLIALLLSCSACFLGRDTGPRVLGLRGQTVVLTGGRSYRVGPVPDGWRIQRAQRHAIVLTNSASKAKITTSIQCGTRREDLPLHLLMGHLFSGIAAEGTPARTPLELDGRAALRERSLRVVDGVPVACDAVVLKKDRCNFDFFLVAPRSAVSGATAVFEQFFQGFAYHP